MKWVMFGLGVFSFLIGLGEYWLHGFDHSILLISVVLMTSSCFYLSRIDFL